MDSKERIKEKLLEALDQLIMAKDLSSVAKSAEKYRAAIAILDNPLKIGAKGEIVSIIQKALKELGFDPGPIDGNFGEKTEEAVKQFQEKQGLTPDGVIEDRTLTELLV